MTFLPIVERELRVRARWRSTYVVRTGIAVVAIAATMVFSLFAVIGSNSAGKGMLLTLGWIAFGFCVLDGFRSTADSVSQEKRDGTLGLLFLTDLRGFDVVLGKFAATSLSSFFGLLATMPALAVPVLIGGVTGAEFWRVVLALLNALFFSLAIGMFVSVLSREERRAWTGTVAVIVICVILMPVLGNALAVRALYWFSPAAAMVHAFDDMYKNAPDLYWLPLACVHLLAWVALAVASVILPRAWQDSRTPAQPTRVAAKSAGAARKSAALLTSNPVLWLATRNASQRTAFQYAVWLLCATGVGVWLWGQGDSTVTWTLFFIALAIHFFITLWVAADACYSFADARTSGALELLLSTPLPVPQIVRGQQLAIRRTFASSITALVIVELALLLAQMSVFIARNEIATAIGAFLLVGFSIGWFLLDVLAVIRVGMWFSLTSQKPTHALSRTVLFVIILPAMLLPCVTVLGPGLMVAKSVVFMTWAQNKLLAEFRRAASGRFEAATTSLKAPPRLFMPPEAR